MAATVFEVAYLRLPSRLAGWMLLSSMPPLSDCLSVWLAGCYCLRGRLSQSAWLPGSLPATVFEAAYLSLPGWLADTVFGAAYLSLLGCLAG